MATRKKRGSKAKKSAGKARVARSMRARKPKPKTRARTRGKYSGR